MNFKDGSDREDDRTGGPGRQGRGARRDVHSGAVSSEVGATLGQATAEGTILNDDVDAGDLDCAGGRMSSRTRENSSTPKLFKFTVTRSNGELNGESSLSVAGGAGHRRTERRRLCEQHGRCVEDLQGRVRPRRRSNWRSGATRTRSRMRRSRWSCQQRGGCHPR